jgi:hypothetical protein
MDHGQSSLGFVERLRPFEALEKTWGILFCFWKEMFLEFFGGGETCAARMKDGDLRVYHRKTAEPRNNKGSLPVLARLREAVPAAALERSRDLIIYFFRSK